MDRGTAWLRLLAQCDGPYEAFDAVLADTLVQLLQRRGEPVLLGWALAVLADLDPWQRRSRRVV